MKKKTKQMNIRLDEDTARYIELASSYHDCTKTDFITKQVVRPEFTEVKFKDTKPLLNLMSNVASNLNQIARALNVLKKGDTKLSEEQFIFIQDNYRHIRNLFAEHDEAMQKSLLEFYEVVKRKKIRPIADETIEEFSDIANESEDSYNGDN